MTKGCNCNNEGICLACLIRDKVLKEYGFDENMIKYHFGTIGLDFYKKYMK